MTVDNWIIECYSNFIPEDNQPQDHKRDRDMAIQVKSTKASVENTFVNFLVYGQAGSGKTTLAATMPHPIVLSAEGGLLSLSGLDIDYIEIKTINDLREAFTFCKSSKEADKYRSVVIDSISEVAEVILVSELKRNKDGRAAYGEMGSMMHALIREFRDLPKHVYMSAKLDKAQDEVGRMMYSPSMPGKALTQTLPYFFDELLALRVEREQDGSLSRFLVTEGDGSWLAKDRSGVLSRHEDADLGIITNKIVKR